MEWWSTQKGGGEDGGYTKIVIFPIYTKFWSSIPKTLTGLRPGSIADCRDPIELYLFAVFLRHLDNGPSFLYLPSVDFNGIELYPDAMSYIIGIEMVTFL